jgi:hypothetical protein
MSVLPRIEKLDWEQLGRDLDERGFAQTPRVLTPHECEELAGLYEYGSFRSRVDMARHRFGEGEYKYFDHPLPAVVADLRVGLYPHLAPVANRWSRALGRDDDYPRDHAGLLARCKEHGQCKPTPLMLRYEAGGYNCLHQDLYGAVVFPLQVVLLLSRPGDDFTGGEFLLVEQRPRAQSRGEALAIGRGEAVIFTTRERPVEGSRGYYRVNVRHGVSSVRSGRRLTLGIIFHDAR